MTLREQGKGKRKRKADSLTEEEEALWQHGVLGHSNPQSLNYTVFYQTSQHLGTRGCQEHHQIYIQNLKFVHSSITGDVEYVEWTEGITKTRQGGLIKTDRRVPQRMFKRGGGRGPVQTIQKLISKCPPSLRSSGPLYLTPLQNTEGKDVWFSNQKVGVNKINGYVREMAHLAGLDKSKKRYTNHSVRKATVRKLEKAGFSNDKIASITGHKSEQTLQEYSATDLDDHRQISHTLAHGRQCPLQKTTNSLSPSVRHDTFTTSSMPSTGTYNFSHCTVSFNYYTSTTSSSSSTSSLCVTAPQKRARIEDSDSD